ncbi:MAG: GDSL-type esterase/lipase family protein [Armatimonadota bacterium]
MDSRLVRRRGGRWPLLIVSGFALAMPSWAAEQNLALNRSYQCNAPNQGGWTGLVDGIKDSDQPPGCFATDGGPQSPKWVVVDLGGVCDISRIEVLNSLNGNTRTVEIYVGVDGEKFVLLRRYIFPDRQLQTLKHVFPPQKARYVKVAFRDTYGGGLAGDNYMFLRELEVWGTGAGGAVAPPVSPTTATPRWLRLFRHYVLESDAEVTVAVLGDCSALPPPLASGPSAFPDILLSLLREQYQSGAGMANKTFRLENLATERSTASSALRSVDGVAALDPQIVIVSLGLVDSLRWQEEAFQRDLGELARRLNAETHAAIILVAPPPIVPQEDKGRFLDVRGKSSEEAAAAVRTVAALTGALLADVPAAFRQSATSSKHLYGDNLHLNRIGHTVVARAILQLLQ